MRTVLAMSLLIVFIAGRSATTSQFDAGRDSVELSIDGRGAVRVPVTIDGRGPLTFLLDTGSTHSVVSKEIADRLRMPAVAKTVVTTSAGRELRPVVKLVRTSIGGASIPELLASVVSSAQMSGTFPGVDGLIGQDFLSAFNYTLDYRRKRLIWVAESAEGGRTTRLALVRQQGRLLAKLVGDGAGAPLLLVPDSGAEQLVIFERDGRTPLRVARAGGVIAASGLGGRATARTATLREFRIGSLRLSEQPVVLLDRTGFDAREGDGLLPLHVFSSVSINSGEGYMLVRQ